MPRWLIQISRKKNQKSASVDNLIAHRDASLVPILQSEQTSPSDSVRSIIEKAVTDAEQIANSIKMKAQQEATEEAARIIDKAKQEAEEIRQQAETVTRREAETKLATKEESKKKTQEAKQAEEARKQAEKEAELTAKEDVRKKAEEAKQAEEARKKAEKGVKLAARDEAKNKAKEAKKPDMPAGEKKGKLGQLLRIKLGKKAKEPGEPKEVQPPAEHKTEPTAVESTTIEKKVEKPAQVEEKADASKIVEPTPKETPKQRVLERKIERQEPVGAPQQLNTETVYEGEVELVIAVPVDPAAVSRLYNYLQSTPDMKILYARGSWDRGTAITVALDKPLPLIGMISKISGLKITPGIPQKDSSIKGASGSLLVTKKKQATRVDLVLKTE